LPSLSQAKANKIELANIANDKLGAADGRFFNQALFNAIRQHSPKNATKQHDLKSCASLCYNALRCLLYCRLASLGAMRSCRSNA
jgi:hypothetical protein